MVGAISIGSSSFTDSHSCPCLCLDPISSSSLNIKNNGELGLSKNLIGKKRQLKKPSSVDLSSSFLDAWYDWRSSTKMLSHIAYGCSRKQRKFRNHGIVDELGGQYEDSFNDVKKQILNYFTYKAVRTVLQQLYEMNPTQYTWFYNFIATNKPGNGKRFIQALGKEKQELAERVMVTRLHLYGKWIKTCDHAQIYKEISDENLELMRERLMETIIWPSDDTDKK
uniref:Chaperonin-like RbcX protein n=1 Tax=Davidia involucrata TaxID=16924 RepID=A0A5B7BYM1_DAVIN